MMLPNRRKDALEIVFKGSSGYSFDPQITTISTQSVTWYVDNDIVSKTSGTTHDLAYTMPDNSFHKLRIVVSGGMDKIDRIFPDNDYVYSIKGINRCVNSTMFNPYVNADLELNTLDIAQMNPARLTAIYISNTKFCGAVVALKEFKLLTTLRIATCPGLSGSLSDLEYMGSLSSLYWYNLSNIGAGSLGPLHALSSVKMEGNGWSAEEVDGVIDSIWQARDEYSYSMPSITIGGTNDDPSGSYGAPSEGTDWTATGYVDENRVLNPGFETWTDETHCTSWELIPYTGTLTREDSIIHGGAHALKLTYGSSGGVASASQVFVLLPEKNYRLTYWARGDGTNQGYFAVYDVTHGSYITASATQPTGVTAAEYTQVTYDFATLPGCYTIRIYFKSSAVAGVSVWVDDISFTKLEGWIPLTGLAKAYDIANDVNAEGFNKWSVTY